MCVVLFSVVCAAGVRSPKDICEQLLDECLSKGSRDNMSAVLVLFASGASGSASSHKK